MNRFALLAAAGIALVSLAAGLAIAEGPRYHTVAPVNQSAVSITGGTITGLSSPLPVASGGSGVATITGALKGNGTSAFTQAAAADLSNGTTGSGAVVLATGGTVSTATSVTAGTSASTATLVGVLNVNTTSTASSQTAKQTLLSYSLPANAMSANGKCVRVKGWGTAKATANNKTQTIDFGATSVASTGAVANNAGVWVVSAMVCRTGASAQAAVGESTSATTVALTNSTPAESTTGAITIALTSTNVTDTDGTTAKGLIVEFLN